MSIAYENARQDSAAGRVARKVALVTGAGRGQGRNHAIRLAEEGADIIAVDICAPVEDIAYPMATEEDLELTEKMVRDRGRSIITAKVDTRDLRALTAVVDRGVAEFGKLDIVVANAGVGVFGPFEEQETDEWKAVLGVNVIGTRNTCLAAMPHLVSAGGGSVVLISSLLGLLATGRLSAYIASKHAVLGLTKALAFEWGPRRIRVNAICPGVVTNTGMAIPDQLTDLEKSSYLTALPTAAVQRDDTSNALLYLASDESRYVTGEIVQVDAGAATI
ncbi:mycofactocin-coupled SDR family oxidoreductase [Actinoplanes sp. NPDC051470]|uniref:mycofactocin-coupled SDR family oxidoreductase n=1 Tax=unclassified Actinoplanes TaxID=2626549 RepID=UPI0034301BA9